LCQELGYLIGLPGLDFLAVQNEDGLAITEQGHGRRRRRMIWKQIANCLDSFQICACKNGGSGVWMVVMLERESDRRARLPCSASAD
jgi:hypothetical protein